jgi:glycosyltransferase involved in cell wall biosynthesis
MTHYPFPPLAGSAIVAYNTMKHLSVRHTIDFVGLQPDARTHPSEFVQRLILVPQRRASSIARVTRHLGYMLTGVPVSVSRSTLKAIREAVKEAVRCGKYDAVLLFEMSAIPYCSSSFYSKIIANIEDPISIKWRRMAKLPIWSSWVKAKMFVLAGLAARYEKRILPKLAKVLLLSSADIHDLREQIEGDNFVHVPYGVDQRNPTEITCYQDRERTIVYSGNMYHPPNVDGALFLLRDIFPLVMERYPAAILWIVGADPDIRIREAAEKFGNRVLITGRVPDIADYIKRATVSICPVRLKIGVQTKILEALSWGTPVVTTSAGNSGVGGVSGTHLWVEDEPLLIAERIVALLQGRDWPRLSEGGRNLIAEQFSWERSAAQIEQTLESLAMN